MTGRTELHICQGNVTGLYCTDNAIDPIVVPNARRHGNAFIFQDDNAGAHRARVVQDYLQFRRIAALQWLAKSPDLSPVEYSGTSSGDVFGDSLKRHRTSTRSLMHSRRNRAGPSKQPLGGSSRA